MTRKRKSDGSFYRSASNEHTEAAQVAVGRAWRALALAGVPRTSRTDRDKQLKLAAAQFDVARGHATTARTRFTALTEGVKRQAQADYQSSDLPAQKAGITILRPLVESLTQDLRSLWLCLQRYGADLGDRSEERAAASRLQPFLDHPTVLRRCCWCGRREEKYGYHYSLDADGYAVQRPEGRRFLCFSCFQDRKDLAEPAPKPLPEEPAAPEPAYAEVNPTRALPARRLALPAHVPTEDPSGPGGER